MSAVTTPQAPACVGELLRDWRRRRRLSQLDLSLEAGVSSRHLSFVETGRAKPSRELVLHLAEQLDVPLRERNALLLAAGFAPVFGEHPLDDEAMAPVRAALETILASQEPFPALVVDERWNLVTANRPAMEAMADAVGDPALLAPGANALRATLHPDGIAPRIVNLAEYSADLLARLHRQAVLSADPSLRALYEELAAYPGVRAGSPIVTTPAAHLFMPLRLRALGAELSLFNTITTFGTALDVTIAELTIESLFPADAATAETLRARFGA
jgi:transcriptional regulator with XRE-family HTH domain